MDLYLLQEELKKFNLYSPTFPIRVEAKAKEMQQEILVGTRDSCAIIRRSSYEFIFEPMDTWADVISFPMCTITTCGEYFIEKAFELSKLICKSKGLMLDIHYLIVQNCNHVIQGHTEGMKNWNEYLANWNTRYQFSIYKTLDEALEAHDKYSRSLEKRVLEYLKLNNKEILEKIIDKNLLLKETYKEMKGIYEEQCLRITQEFRILKRHLYYFDWDKDCIN